METLIKLCWLGNTTTGVDANIDQDIIALGLQHGVGAWCYSRLISIDSKYANDELLLPWKKLYIQTSIKYQQKLKVFTQIKKLFLKDNISVIALKGMALASGVYKDEGVRPMGDMDLLVPEGEGMRALQILLKAGAQMTVVPRSVLHEEVHSHVRAILFHGILIEIHQRLFSMGGTFYIDSIDLFEHSINITKQGVNLQILSDLHMGYHLVAHAASNIVGGGLRLGWLLDVALLWNQVADKNKYMLDVLAVKPCLKKEMTRVFYMASLFLPNLNRSVLFEEKEVLQDISSLMIVSKVEEKHRVINIVEILRTPGLDKKMKLLWREFFPVAEYMRYRYKTHTVTPWLYFKRIFRF
ncbi:nucleotidyltransferase family protein [Saccharicrinis carchari]|uniref:nucleotidyltransferase family protein n=1 Tax=Saccharicrinis carchari TaxID=1168039 RepID=UPI00163D9146|nr:nucleotidyltransferase family protein [Saccharicrinis carchari]